MNIINYKLISFLELLSKEDLTEFKKFISSPIYSSGRNYLPLLEEILLFKKEQVDKISATELYEKVYPGKKFSGQTLKNRFSELLKLGEEYIIYKDVQKDHVERDSILLKAYLDNKMFKFYESKYKKAYNHLNSQKTDDKKFSDIYSLNQKNLNYLTETEKIDKFYSTLYEHTIYSTSISLISLLDYGIEFLQQEYLGRRYNFNIVLNILKKINLVEILEKYEGKDLEVLKVVHLYYYLYKAYEDLSVDSYYFDARKLFKKISVNFSDEYKLKFYMIFIYYCTRRQNLGDKKFISELFKLYNEKLDLGFVSDFTEKIYPVNNFRDYVFIGIELGKTDWVIEFIKKYNVLLPKKVREHETNLSYSKLYFYNSDFEKSLEFVLKVKSNNYMHYLDSSILKLLNYYELDGIEEAYFEIDKLKHYLSNHNEIPKIHKTYNRNFIKIYGKLLKLKIDPKRKDLIVLEGELKNIPFVSKREWVCNKILELMK